MSIDGKVFYRAKTIFDSERQTRQAEFNRRVEGTYRESPLLAQLDRQIRGSMNKVISLALSRGENVRQAVEQVKTENLSLQRRRTDELRRLGHPSDWLDEKPACPLCGDTGYRDGQICSCLMAVYRREQVKELSKLLNMRDDTFEAFRLDYYPPEPDPSTGVSPRQSMTVVYEYCRAYADSFGSSSPNLYFTGGTGLGKTFLSTAIANVVSKNGFSVVYETAAELCRVFETAQFARADSDGEDIKRYMSCDLLILDDLGTELTTAFTMSALYTLINNRLASDKKTIISSNLTRAELRRRYSPQIVSRIEGEYKILSFTGRDIRLLKNR